MIPPTPKMVWIVWRLTLAAAGEGVDRAHRAGGEWLQAGS